MTSDAGSFRFSAHRLGRGVTIVVDDLANKGERDRSHISLQRSDETRYWTRHLGVDLATLQTVIAKVGNAAPSVRKELAASKKSNTQGSPDRRRLNPT